MAQPLRRDPAVGGARHHHRPGVDLPTPGRVVAVGDGRRRGARRRPRPLVLGAHRLELPVVGDRLVLPAARLRGHPQGLPGAGHLGAPGGRGAVGREPGVRVHEPRSADRPDAADVRRQRVGVRAEPVVAPPARHRAGRARDRHAPPGRPGVGARSAPARIAGEPIGGQAARSRAFGRRHRSDRHRSVPRSARPGGCARQRRLRRARPHVDARGGGALPARAGHAAPRQPRAPHRPPGALAGHRPTGAGRAHAARERAPAGRAGGVPDGPPGGHQRPCGAPPGGGVARGSAAPRGRGTRHTARLRAPRGRGRRGARAPPRRGALRVPARPAVPTG